MQENILETLNNTTVTLVDNLTVCNLGNMTYNIFNVFPFYISVDLAL